MRVTIESTTRIVSADGIDCRVWEGQTEKGVKIQYLICRVAVLPGEDISQFEAELKELKPPSIVQAFPLRLIL